MYDILFIYRFFLPKANIINKNAWDLLKSVDVLLKSIDLLLKSAYN